MAPGCKYSFKTQMLIGSIGYSINMSTGIYAPYISDKTYVYLIVAFGGFLGGCTAGYLWVSQGGYLREVCKG